MCQVGCSFCGFSREKDAEDAYDHSLEVLVEKARNAQARGATEVCIQGGIHPDKDHTDYHAILTAIHRELPALHIHAFSPEEIDHEYRLGEKKTMINVGSVGQPRDGDPRACYVVLEDNVVHFRHVEYDFETTIKKIYEVPDLDNFLGDRLRDGR